ncbi:MAG: sulfofructose kinase [Chloroflexota bacterium]|nr:sulfofructose kinase [Chloroflexota bacterium]
MQEAYSVFIGDVALDEYYRTDYWPTVKDKALVDALPAVPGGMIANAACVSAALGMNVKFLAALNSGAITQFLLEDLERSGVDTSLVVFDDALADSKTMIFLVGSEHTVIIPRLGLEHIELTRDQLKILAGAQYLYTTPSEIATLQCGDMDSRAIIRFCREQGARLVYDVDVDYIQDGGEERFKDLDIVFFNEVGFERYRGVLDADAAAQRLLGYGLEIVVVTMAEQGCGVYTQEEMVSCPAFPVEVVDVTGAGDTFCSSFLYALSAGKNIRYAAEFANAAASICVGHLGARAGAVPRQEIEKLLRL